MNKTKLFGFLALIIVIQFSAANSEVKAFSNSDFPVCANPQGNVIASYDSGTHGVVGSTATYSGKDTVYILDSNRLMQCFCPENGNAIQTNWQKISAFSEEELPLLLASGWVYVEDGSLWGLDNEAYLAYNLNYSCNSSSVGGSSDSSQGGSESQAAILTANQVGSVLGLANTGNMAMIIFTLLTGITSLFIGLLLHQKSAK